MKHCCTQPSGLQATPVPKPADAQRAKGSVHCPGQPSLPKRSSHREGPSSASVPLRGQWTARTQLPGQGAGHGNSNRPFRVAGVGRAAVPCADGRRSPVGGTRKQSAHGKTPSLPALRVRWGRPARHGGPERLSGRAVAGRALRTAPCALAGNGRLPQLPAQDTWPPRLGGRAEEEALLLQVLRAAQHRTPLSPVQTHAVTSDACTQGECHQIPSPTSASRDHHRGGSSSPRGTASHGQVRRLLLVGAGWGNSGEKRPPLPGAPALPARPRFVGGGARKDKLQPLRHLPLPPPDQTSGGDLRGNEWALFHCRTFC